MDSSGLRRKGVTTPARSGNSPPPEAIPDRATRLLKAIGEIQAGFIANGSPKETFAALLDTMLSVTGSEYGFIGEVLYEDGKPYLKTHAITDIAWNAEMRKRYAKGMRDGLEFHNLDTLFGKTVSSGSPVISNAFPSEEAEATIPKGHPSLQTFLGLPIYAGEAMVGVAAVANRAEGYDEAIVEFLAPLLMTCGSILLAYRTEMSRRQADALRARSEDQFKLVFDAAPNGMLILDPQGAIELVNVRVDEMFGYGRRDLLGESFEKLIPERLRSDCALLELVKGTVAIEAFELVGLRKDGSEFSLEVGLDPIDTASGMRILASVVDVTERKRLQSQIKHQAFHDALTGLPNRLLFMDRLTIAQARAKRHMQGVAVIFIDLDNFKVINDSLGHQAGDRFLMGITERLKSCVRPEDTVARLGGDEFTILLELRDVDDAIKVADRLVEAIRQPFAIPGAHREVVSTASVGIAYSANGEESADSLLRDADTAMYYAKDSGKAGYVLFDQSMNSKAVERMELELGLRQALDRREFRLYYQPIVNLFTGRVSGAEALIRWEHPTRGLVPPDQFIPIAEETGLIGPVGHWALKTACAQLREWLDRFGAESGLTMSVNLSGRQLQRRDIVDQVVDVLRETKVEASWLKLEITESVLMNDVEDAVAKLRGLRELGIKLAVDDFGTGYSSMSSLSSFPVDTVKIDRAFISRLCVDDDAEAIVAAVIMLSKSIRLETTAEGLENQEQLMFLKALGCNCAQGFYFAKALPAEQCGHWLEEMLAERKCA